MGTPLLAFQCLQGGPSSSCRIEVPRFQGPARLALACQNCGSAECEMEAVFILVLLLKCYGVKIASGFQKIPSFFRLFSQNQGRCAQASTPQAYGTLCLPKADSRKLRRIAIFDSQGT